MLPADLRDLADDIAKNGLREAVTLTPAGELLDGRNRERACAMAGVEITPEMTVVHHGDPWAYSFSKNRHRRHLNADALAMVAATWATQAHGANQHTSNEASSIPAIAKAAGIPKTAVESAKAVLKDGTADEIEAVRTGMAKLRKTADAVRARVRPAAAKTSKSPIDPSPPSRPTSTGTSATANGARSTKHPGFSAAPRAR
jgi:hypothetical protein